MDGANGPLTPTLSPSEGAREIIEGAAVPGAALASPRLPRAILFRPAGALALARFARTEGF